LHEAASLHIWIGMLTPVPGRGAAKEQIVIAVPVELKNVVEPIEALSRAVEEARKSARGGGAVDCAVVERTVEERAAAIERAAHAEILPALEVDAPRVTSVARPTRGSRSRRPERTSR